MVFCPEHPKRDQNPKFTPLSEGSCGVPPPPLGDYKGHFALINYRPQSSILFYPIFLPPHQLMAMSGVSLNTKFVDEILVVPFE